MSPDEFSARTCSDMSLPPAFNHKISIQITEQISSYREIISLFHSDSLFAHKLLKNIQNPIQMMVGLRHNNLDYLDKFTWDLYSYSNGADPEIFARKTCEDLGLPLEMEPAISHRIRESLMKIIISSIELNDSSKQQSAPDLYQETESDIKISLVQPNISVDMISNLCKRAKPHTAEDQAYIPQPMLPKNRYTNALIWDISPVPLEAESKI